MNDPGRYAAFIWSSYGIAAIVIALLIGWLILDGRRQIRALADFEARGITRRSKAKSTASGVTKDT